MTKHDNGKGWVVTICRGQRHTLTREKREKYPPEVLPGVWLRTAPCHGGVGEAESNVEESVKRGMGSMTIVWGVNYDRLDVSPR